MDNAETIFYILVIASSAAISIWAINGMIQTSPRVQERRKNKRLAEIAKKYELARKQNALVAVATEQKSYYANH